MSSALTSKSVWIRRQQCPCGDWKCYVSNEGEAEGTSGALQLVKSENLSSESMVAPYVGMVFTTDEDAFEYYGNFARKNGFSIRKERSRLSPQLGVYKRDIVCYRSGFAPVKKKLSGEPVRDRKSARCGCDAKMHLVKEVVDGVSQWSVVQFSNVHNHELLEDEQVRLLPAYRKIQEADQERILLLSKAGFTVNRIVKMLELEKGIQGGQLPFLERDVRNFVQNRKKAVQENDALLTEKRENDAMELLEACKTMKETDDGFVYDCTVDENDKVENIAWSYGYSIHEYSTFGDVVYFDTSYRSVTYGLFFGAWLGIDNNGKLVFFGCALLQDETSHSFVWALRAFVRFMGGRCPQTVLTDLDPRLKESVRAEWQNTKHVTNIWSVLPRLSCWFSNPLGTQYSEFKTEFEVLYRLESPEDFEFQWNQMVSQFGLGSDKHISLLFSMRASWASSFTKGYPLAQIATQAYCKCITTFLNGIFSAQTCLRSFFEQVGVSANLQSQLREEMQYVPIKTSTPIEEHARGILTPFAFNAFQHELVLAMQYVTSDLADGSCLVSHFKKMDVDRFVLWMQDEIQIHCSCKEFESSGIMCRHSLRVLIVKNCFQVPEIYFPPRWRRESSLFHCDDQNLQAEDDWFQEFHSLSRILFAEASFSKERSGHIRTELRRELTRLLDEIRKMPVRDVVVMDFRFSPTS